MGLLIQIDRRTAEVCYHYPSDQLDYTIIYTLPVGDTIQTSTWVVSGIQKLSESLSSPNATIWVTGGSAETRAYAINSIVTAQGRTFQSIIYFNIRALD